MSADPIAFSDEELLDLLRDPTVSPDAISREMAGAGAPPLSVAELEQGRACVTAIESATAEQVASLPPRLRDLAFAQILAKRLVGLASELLGSKDKAVVKEAKRVAHILKTQGVKVEAAKAAAPAAPATQAADEFPVFMTNVDGFGERILLLARGARGGVDVAQVVVSDTSGVVDARLAPLARKEFRKFVQNLSRSSGVLVGEVPRAYARGLITAALDLNARARRPVPQGWHDVAFVIGPSTPPQPSPGRELPRPDDLAALASRPADLLALDELRTWMPAEEALKPVALKVEEVASSPVYVDDTQREAAVRGAVAEAVRGYWTTERRALGAERLYDLAWLFHGAGRAEHAALAAASAAWLGEDRPLENVPFAYALFEKLLPVLRSGQKPAPTKPAGGVIVPG